MKVALVDVDHLLYIISYRYRESEVTDEVHELVTKATDAYLNEMILLAGCNHYVIAISGPPYFRDHVYKYASYKGTRGEKPEFFVKWEPKIFQHLLENWHICVIPGLEADDIVAAMQCRLHEHKVEYVICSPDKDLNQIHGFHFNYQMQDTEGDHTEMVKEFTRYISESEAFYTFWLQMLTGDSGDNVAGIPGLGPVKAKKFLEILEPVQYKANVHMQYTRYYGDFYGRLIFQETFETLLMLTTSHPRWKEYESYIRAIQPQEFVPIKKADIFDIS